MKTTMKLTEKRRIESSINACGKTYVVVCDDDHDEAYPLFRVGVKLLGNEFECIHVYSGRSQAISAASEMAINLIGADADH